MHKAVDDFFQKWTNTFPEETKNCRPDEELVNLARNVDTMDWPLHVKTCDHCASVIKLLQGKETPHKLVEFLQEANGDPVGGGVSKRAWTMPPIFKTFGSLGQPRWVSVALAVTLALFAFTWIINPYGSSDNIQRPAVVSLEEDQYAIAVNLLQSSVNRMNDPNISPKDLASELNKSGPAINQRLAVLNDRQLAPQQRADLAKLVTTYRNQATILEASLHTAREPRPNAAPQIIPTPDSDVVTKLYAQAHPTIKKKPETEKEPSEVQVAMASQQGAREVNIIAFNGTEFQIQDLKPDRTPQEKQALQANIDSFLNTQNMRATYVSGSPATLPKTAWVPQQ